MLTIAHPADMTGARRLVSADCLLPPAKPWVITSHLGLGINSPVCRCRCMSTRTWVVRVRRFRLRRRKQSLSTVQPEVSNSSCPKPYRRMQSQIRILARIRPRVLSSRRVMQSTFRNPHAIRLSAAIFSSPALPRSTIGREWPWDEYLVAHVHVSDLSDQQT